MQKFKKSLSSFDERKTENSLFGIRDQMKLDLSMYGYFDKCALANESVTKKHFFPRFYERKDKYR